jgi:hypothetical protein
MRPALCVLVAALVLVVPTTSLQVQITDATTGAAISNGVRCTIFDEGNAFLAEAQGGYQGCLITNPSSSSEVFELTVEKDGYFSSNVRGIASTLGSTIVQLSPKFTGGAATKEIRAVLSWGSFAQDLDAHLVVPPINAEGSSCTVNYQQKAG